MRRKLQLARLLAATLLAACFCLDATPSAADLWLTPLDPFPRPWGIKGPQDYFELFRQGASWQDTMRRVSVFEIYPQFTSDAPPEQLRELISFLKSRNIRLALEAGVLTAGGTCGQNVESYGGQYLIGIAKKIKEAGGTLDLLAMDEPLWFGGYFSGPRACHADIDELAKNAAQSLKALRTIFPNIAVGDIEPAPTSVEVKYWNVDVIVRWAKAFRAATGRNLAFLHIDMQWKRRWAEPVKQLEAELKQLGIPLGVIYNGEPQDTDQEFSVHTKQHYTAMETVLGHAPATIIFQSWRPAPSKVLPETDPLTMTGIVKQYLDSRPQR